MFKIKFPYDTGTFVKTPQGLIGTISCYQAIDEYSEEEGFTVMVSGFHEPWYGEYLLSELNILEDENE